MPLGTVDRSPPPFFKQGASAVSKLMVFSALALLLMVADARLNIATPLRAVVSVALAPLQWVVMQPVQAVRGLGGYFGSLQQAQAEAQRAESNLLQQVQRAALVEHLAQENESLRSLLKMNTRLGAPAVGAEVLYDAADPYGRKVVVNRGQTHGVTSGSAVMDGYGVIGQVTQVYPFTAEVTLLTDRDQAIPVLNTRTGQRSLAFGLPDRRGDRLELRFVPANTDLRVGDVLTTSGVDGVYPAGLPVAQISHIERRGESGFARVECTPTAQVAGALRVLVLTAARTEPKP
ncbi:MAG: Cell shape-determining protein MreC [Pseudomonadota bacterium]|jgi:rod shape-determining protein MreC